MIPEQWRTNIPNYARFITRDVYPGVDLVYYGNQGRLEYDLVVEPGGDPRAIALEIENGNSKFDIRNLKRENRNSKFEDRQSKIRIAANGELVIATEGGEVRLKKPVVYQETGTGARGWGLGNCRFSRTPGPEPRTPVIINHQSAIENFWTAATC